MTKPVLTQETVRELLDYDPLTGIFIWKERDPKWFKAGIRNPCKIWNSHYSGNLAGTINSHGYWMVGIKNVKYLAHRLAWLHVHGENPKELDHINQNPLDNRIKNLRVVTHLENGKNQVLRKNNTSGVMGVYWRKDINKWAAQLVIERKVTPLGTYTNMAEAILGEKAWLPPQPRSQGCHDPVEN